MKLKSIIATIALALVFSVSAAAQCPKERTANCPKKEQCQTDATCPKAKCDKDQKSCPMFEGITLTADQKASLEKLCQDRKDKKQCDRSQCLEEIKKILTPEQYVKFLENIAKKDIKRPGQRHHRGPQPKNCPNK